MHKIDIKYLKNFNYFTKIIKIYILLFFCKIFYFVFLRTLIGLTLPQNILIEYRVCKEYSNK